VGGPRKNQGGIKRSQNLGDGEMIHRKKKEKGNKTTRPTRTWVGRFSSKNGK